MAKPPKMLPMAEALRFCSWPIKGTTKVCTSQQDAITQLIHSMRRNMGSLNRSQALRLGCSGSTTMAGSSCTWRTHHQANKGSMASMKKAA